MEAIKDKVEVKRLAKLAKVIKGVSFDEAALKEIGDIPYLTPDNIEFTGLTFDCNSKYATSSSLESNTTLTSVGDILICIKEGSVYWYQVKNHDPRSFPGQGIVVIRSKHSA